MILFQVKKCLNKKMEGAYGKYYAYPVVNQTIGIKNKTVANSEDEFSVAKNIEGVKLRSRATGDLMSVNLNLDASLKKATAVVGGSSGSDNPGSSSSGGSGTGSDSSSTPGSDSGTENPGGSGGGVVSE